MGFSILLTIDRISNPPKCLDFTPMTTTTSGADMPARTLPCLSANEMGQQSTNNILRHPETQMLVEAWGRQAEEYWVCEEQELPLIAVGHLPHTTVESISQ